MWCMHKLIWVLHFEVLFNKTNHLTVAIYKMAGGLGSFEAEWIPFYFILMHTTTPSFEGEKRISSLFHLVLMLAQLRRYLARYYDLMKMYNHVLVIYCIKSLTRWALIDRDVLSLTNSNGPLTSLHYIYIYIHVYYLVVYNHCLLSFFLISESDLIYHNNINIVILIHFYIYLLHAICIYQTVL